MSRAYAHIATSYVIHESNMHRLIKWIEDILVKDRTFSLPDKKALCYIEPYKKFKGKFEKAASSIRQ